MKRSRAPKSEAHAVRHGLRGTSEFSERLPCLYSRSDPPELPELPDPERPELDDWPEAGLCGEICPLPVPVLPALVYWLLPVPGPPDGLRILSSALSVFDHWSCLLGLLCCVDDCVPPIFELPDWFPRFICCCEPVLPD